MINNAFYGLVFQFIAWRGVQRHLDAQGQLLRSSLIEYPYTWAVALGIHWGSVWRWASSQTICIEKLLVERCLASNQGVGPIIHLFLHATAYDEANVMGVQPPCVLNDHLHLITFAGIDSAFMGLPRML